MKKNYLLVGLTGLLLAGCSNEDVVSDGADSPKAISFGTFVQKPTKATPIAGTDFPSGGNFMVLGYNTGTDDTWSAAATKTLNFMRQTVTYNGTSYTYSPAKYWPNGTPKISFFAVSPADISTITPAALSTAGLPTVSYEVPTDPLEQKDVMLAKALNKTSADVTVSFPFVHALTKIGFTAKLAADYSTSGIYVRITSIALQNVANTAEYAVDGTTGAWAQTAPTTWATTYTLDALKHLVNSGYVTSTEKSTIILSNSYLMMVPFNYKTDNKGSKLVVTYDISYPDGTISTGNTKDQILFNLGEGAGNNWEMGKAVNYNLTITVGGGSGSGSAVAFDAAVSDWTAPTDVAIP
jgi:hypothetical protein